jgi:hypothetical protein
LIAWMRAGRWRRQLRAEQRTIRRLEGEMQEASPTAPAPEAASEVPTTKAA